MKPNLFSFATKELSQDAFLAWFLQWADPSCRQHNAGLHAVACAFVSQLISLQGTPPAQITNIETGRQWENMDVWAEVNDSHFIVIEDKVGSGQHSDQLARYRATALAWCQKEGRQLICVYIKTQSDSALNLEKVREQGFAVLSRRDLLSLLESHDVANDIYLDFRDRLRQIESSESQFGEKKLGTWDDNDWKGFFQALEKKRHVGNWGYAPNPAGGFWYAVLNWLYCGDVSPYMQIEGKHGRLCFRVEVGEGCNNHAAIRTQLHDLLMSHSTADLGLERPSRFGLGNTMTVAIVPRSVWLGGDNDLIDLDATLARLHCYETWFADTIVRAPEDCGLCTPPVGTPGS